MTKVETFPNNSNFNPASDLNYSGLPFSWDQVSRLSKTAYSLIANNLEYIAQINSILLNLKENDISRVQSLKAYREYLIKDVNRIVKIFLK